jgi:hypothetical protein
VILLVHCSSNHHLLAPRTTHHPHFISQLIVPTRHSLHDCLFSQGPSPSAVREQLEIVKAVAEGHGGRDAVCVEGPEETAQLWTVRKQCLWAAMSR